MTTTSKEEVSLLARHCKLRSEGLFLAWLFSPKQQPSRRVLKKSDSLFFREMTQGSSTRGPFLHDVLGTSPDFSERMSEVASTGHCGHLSRAESESTQPKGRSVSVRDSRHITSAYPNHIWGIDITYIRWTFWLDVSGGDPGLVLALRRQLVAT
jgi:hypothetical protein